MVHLFCHFILVEVFTACLTSDMVMTLYCSFRDRPFNLQGGGGYGFLFRSEKFFRTTRELEYFYFQNLTLGYMTKTLNQIIFLSSTKIRIFFSATLGIRIFFLEKNHNPPFKLNGPSLRDIDSFAASFASWSAISFPAILACPGIQDRVVRIPYLINVPIFSLMSEIVSM